MASQLGSMLAGPSVVPEAQMLGLGPEMYNCMECKYPLLSFPVWMRARLVLRQASHQTIFAAERRTKEVDCTVGNHYFSGATAARQGRQLT